VACAALDTWWKSGMASRGLESNVHDHHQAAIF